MPQQFVKNNSIKMASGNFSLDLLKCPLCENIPLKYRMVFCDNGHLVCVSCRSQMKDPDKCPVCQGALVSRRNYLYEKIIDSIELVNCKNKNFGCAKTLTSDEKDDHENQCEFRMISCFERECKPMKNQLAITSFKEHYESNHWDRKEEIQDEELSCGSSNTTTNNDIMDEIEFEVKSDFAIFRQSGRLEYLFVKVEWMEELPSSFKACLISTASQEKVKKLKCTIRLVCDDDEDKTEIFSYEGNVFSVDDTENIFSWKSGGLIYPKEIGSYPFGIDGQCLKMMVNISSKDDENDN